MTHEDPRIDLTETIGLCATCRHSRQVRTPRSTFRLCARAATDPSFEKYPRLPVRLCPGYEPGDPAGAGPAGP